MKPIQDTIHSLQLEFEKNDSVLAFVLVGSQARKNGYLASEFSDLEAYIVVKDNGVEKIETKLKNTVNSLGEVIFSYRNRWAGFSVVFADLFRLELPVVKETEIERVFSRPVQQTVEIIFDKTNGKLQKVLDVRPVGIDHRKLFDDVYTDFWYMMIVAVQYFKKGEVWNSRNALQVNIVSLIKMFELWKNQKALLLEANKRIEEFLAKKQLDLLKDVSPQYDSMAMRHSLERIMEVFSEAVMEVSEKYGFEYNKNIEKEIKPKLIDMLHK